MMPGIRIFLGLLLLLLGRRLYWVMVGVGGLLAGLELTEQLLAEWTPAMRFAVAIAAGAVGVLLAIFAQRVAFAMLGFFAGGFIALVLTQSTTGDSAQSIWFMLGAVAGAIIAAVVMDWAIVALTSVVGAVAIATSISMAPALQAVAFVILAAVGIAIQSTGVQREAQQLDAPSGSSVPREPEP